jgi:hypothetical protein
MISTLRPPTILQAMTKVVCTYPQRSVEQSTTVNYDQRNVVYTRSRIDSAIISKFETSFRCRVYYEAILRPYRDANC